MDKKSYTGLTKQTVKVAPFSTLRIDYNDTKPNYYRVQNTGDSVVYCGTSHMPTAKNYDFLCNAQSMKMYAEPFNRTALYIYNPSGNEVNIVVLSFSAEFDPLTLALSEINLDLSATDIEVSTAISNFNTPLPSGSNTIGKVNLVEASSIEEKIDAIKTAINDKSFTADIAGDVTATIDNSDVVNSLTDFKDDLITVVDSISTEVSRFRTFHSQIKGLFTPNDGTASEAVIYLKIKELSEKLDTVAQAINDKNFNIDNSNIIEAVNNSAKPKVITNIGENLQLTGYGSKDIIAGSGKKITCIDFISNDAETDITLVIDDNEITIKSGEVLNNVRTYADRVMIAEDNGRLVNLRYLVSIEEV